MKKPNGKDFGQSIQENDHEIVSYLMGGGGGVGSKVDAVYFKNSLKNFF